MKDLYINGKFVCEVVTKNDADDLKNGDSEIWNKFCTYNDCTVVFMINTVSYFDVNVDDVNFDEVNSRNPVFFSEDDCEKYLEALESLIELK